MLKIIILSLLVLYTNSYSINSKEIKEELVYYNQKYGYQITFPEIWRDYYTVIENEDGTAIIYFTGRSKTCYVFDESGLMNFYITTEKILYENISDNEKEIGSIGSIKFFYATNTDTEVTMLLCVAENVGSGREGLPFEVDEEEIRLAAQDWKQLLYMEESLDVLLQSFKLIETQEKDTTISQKDTIANESTTNSSNADNTKSAVDGAT